MAEGNVSLPSLPWRDPPPPLGRGHGGGAGYAWEGMSNVELGEIVEDALIAEMGFVSALDRGGSSHVRKGAIDLLYGDAYAVECRAVTDDSHEYKIRMKPAEAARRNSAALGAGLQPVTVMVVVTGTKGHVYWREGIGSFRLNRMWTYAGEVQLWWEGT